MELKEFLKKFLPDYDGKISEVKGDDLDEQVALYMHWQNKYFPESFENFADSICEKQRKICADLANDILFRHYFPTNLEYRSILECEQPKIEDTIKTQ
jgi:hypothetical protein